jgi:hypothetical protein
MGKKTMATNADKIKPPLTKIGALGLALGILTAIIGAQSPPSRFKQLDIPVAVPRLGAGKTSVFKLVSVFIGILGITCTYQACMHRVRHT